MQNYNKNLEFPNNYAEILKKNQETYANIANIEKDVQDEQRANALMKEKSYAQDNKALKIIARFTSYLTSSFSIASGLYFLYSTFLLVLYFDILSWIVAGILLIVLEISKHISTSKTLELYYRGRNVVAYLLFVIILLSLSILFSIKGVEAFYSQVMHEKPVLVSVSSISKEYETRIREIEKQRKDFVSSVSWQGQINIYDQQIRNSLANFDTQIAKLREEKNKATQKAENKNTQTENKNNSKHITSVLYLVLIFGLNELFCMVSLWYGVYYYYRVNKETNYRSLFVPTPTKETVNVSEPIVAETEKTLIIAKPKSIFNQFSKPIVPDELKKKNDDLPNNYNKNNIGFNFFKTSTDAGTKLGTETSTDAGTEAGTETSTDTGTDDFTPKYEVLLACVDEYETTNTIDGRVKKGLNPELRLKYLKFIEQKGLDYCKQVLVMMRTEQNESVKKRNKQNEIF